jgi:hypothetical protein
MSSNLRYRIRGGNNFQSVDLDYQLWGFEPYKFVVVFYSFLAFRDSTSVEQGIKCSTQACRTCTHAVAKAHCEHSGNDV